MRRLIFGAVAVVTGLLAALGIGLTRRRRGRDEVLPVEPAPALAADASVEADFGATGQPAEVDPPTPPKRKPRVRRKRAKAAEPEAAMSTAAAEPAAEPEAAEAAQATTQATTEAAQATTEATAETTEPPAEA